MSRSFHKYTATVMFELGDGWDVRPFRCSGVFGGCVDYTLQITKIKTGIRKYTSQTIDLSKMEGLKSAACDAAKQIKRAFHHPPGVCALNLQSHPRPKGRSF